MATEAAQLECKESTGRKEKKTKKKTHLTHTGLLMEGVSLPKDRRMARGLPRSGPGITFPLVYQIEQNNLGFDAMLGDAHEEHA